MHALLGHLLDWYSASLQSGGYPLIILLMAIESSVVPLPSEFIIPPAAYLAYSHGQMSPAGVVAAGTLGSWIGATIMYWAARIAGRPLVLSFAAWWTAWLKRHPLIDRLPFVHFSPETVERAERWSARFGKMGVFVSRLVPVVRHLIGIPSGVVRVNFGQYSASTVAGALVWCIVLAAVGIAAGNNPALMQGDLRAVGLAVAGAALVLGTVYYFFVYRVMKVERPAA